MRRAKGAGTLALAKLPRPPHTPLMCGRVLLATPVAELSRLFGFPELPNLSPRYNIAPTQDIATVRADGSLMHERQVGSIHGLGKELQGAPSCNGWMFWHYEAGGEIKPIDAARQLYLLGVED